MKLFLILMALISGPTYAWQSPDEALAKFLAFELAGGRLQSWQFSRYLAVGKAYEEPGWDSVVLVKSYSASSMKCMADICSALVTFQLVSTGAAVGNAGQIEPHPQGGAEAFTFFSIQRDGQWLLGPFKRPPHILASARAGH